jgi:hypothetical protein
MGFVVYATPVGLLNITGAEACPKKSYEERHTEKHLSGTKSGHFNGALL